MSPEPASVSDHTLSQADLRNLTSVLIDDPLRSVQSLPGVTTGDDFYAENLTFENTSGNHGQALAIHVAADRAVFRHWR